MNTRHNWTKQDDYYVYCLYVLKITDSQKLEKVAQDIGCKLGSLKMRIKNFEYIDTNAFLVDVDLITIHIGITIIQECVICQ